MYYIPNCTDYEVKNLSKYKPTKAERNYAYLAFNLALTSKVKHGKHCAIIIDKNENILSVFVNKYNTEFSSIHSEVGAIKKFEKENPGKSLKNCKMLVVRGNFLGKFTMSKPCIDCYNTILESGIKTIIYSSGNVKFERIII